MARDSRTVSAACARFAATAVGVIVVVMSLQVAVAASAYAGGKTTSCDDTSKCTANNGGEESDAQASGFLDSNANANAVNNSDASSNAAFNSKSKSDARNNSDGADANSSFDSNANADAVNNGDASAGAFNGGKSTCDARQGGNCNASAGRGDEGDEGLVVPAKAGGFADNSEANASAVNNSNASASATDDSKATAIARNNSTADVNVAHHQNGYASANHGGLATVTPFGVSCSGNARAKLKGLPGGTQKC